MTNAIEGVQPLPEDGSTGINNQQVPTDVPTDTPKEDPQVDPETSKEGDTGSKEVAPDASKDDLLKPLKKAEKVEPEAVPKEQLVTDLVSEIIEGDSQELSEDQLARLKETGLTQDMLNTLVNAEVVTRKENDNAVFELVGGKDVYQEMAEYAANEYSDEQLEAYNSAVFSGNKEMARLAILGLQADYNKSKGPQGPKETLMGSDSPATSDTFSSQQECINALRDHRYGRDAEYTQMIDAKRAKSRY